MSARRVAVVTAAGPVGFGVSWLLMDTAGLPAARVFVVACVAVAGVQLFAGWWLRPTGRRRRHPASRTWEDSWT